MREGILKWLQRVSHGDWHLEQLTIGERLAMGFIVILLLMLVGNAVAFWQFQVVRKQTQRLYQVKMKSLTVLRVHTDVLSFRYRLENLIMSRQAGQLRAEATPLRQSFVEDVDRAVQALRAVPSGAE